MKTQISKNRILSVALCALLNTVGASAGTLYVWQGSPSPGPPHTNWATAAHTIQDAVDAAFEGDTVLVSGGAYVTGGRAVVGLMTNRVAIDKAIRVESLMGPEVTVIAGAAAPGGTDGDGAVRCVYVGANAVLSGFTLTNGHTLAEALVNGTAETRGGGAWCETLGVLTNCLITGNSAANDGGGGYGGQFYWCTLANNFSSRDGGAVDHGTLYNCTLTENRGRKGGGADDSILFNCVLTGNRARLFGGGAARSELHNCTLIRNSASTGGGVAGDRDDEPCRLYNCIVYHNHAPVSPNYDDSTSTLSFSCTTPLPGAGTGNIAADPQLASWSHLSSSSPCIGAGNFLYASGVDIDGELWSAPRPCMGADQMVPGGAMGLLVVALETACTNMTTGFAASFRAQIEGQTTASRWTFGDGTVVSNRLELVHAWSAPGVYEARLTAFNDAHPAGVSATTTIHVVEGVPVAYVNSANPNPVFPYATWATAATNIQNAVGASDVAGRVVWVTNGVYATGGVAVWGQMTNRIALSNGVVVRSVNGPALTILRGAPSPGGTNGDGAIRCAYVGDGSLLDGFTLTNGHTRASGDNSREQGGGGAWCEQTGVVTNCTFLGNEAFRDGGGANGGIFHGCTFRDNRAGDDSGGVDDAVLYNCILMGNQANVEGGGSGESTLYNCTLTGNSARRGGGAVYATLNNCTLTGNSAAGGGGGAFSCSIYNCIVYYNTDNTASTEPNYNDCTLNYCCTTPQPTQGLGNLDRDPQLASASHLSAASPCIGSGSPTYATGTDIDGESWGSPPSIGCDEYWPGAVTGPLKVAIRVGDTNVAVGIPAAFTAKIDGRVSASRWDFGDGTVVSNRPWATHTWTTAGEYAVVLTAFNDSQPSGVSTSVVVHAVVQAPVHYVAANSVNPAAPYLSWATAAQTIQDAVNAAQPGDTVRVTNGVYSRVTISEAITVESVMGSEVTVIDGGGAGRCATLDTNAELRGFTLRNGRAHDGGGVFGGTLYDCILTQNSVVGTGDDDAYGGGACQSTLHNCILTANEADGEDEYAYGGGAAYSTLYHCTLANNWTDGDGGGAIGSTLFNCIVTGNATDEDIGGALQSTLQNCVVSDNVGTGASSCILSNCTVTGNSGGGVAGGSVLYNCIVFHNTAQGERNYYASDRFEYSCTSPLPTSGTGNIDADPQLASASHLSATSPCIGAGSATYSSGVDIDGEPWADPPCMGADQFVPGGTTGALTVAIETDYSQVAVGFGVPLQARIDGRTTASQWDFGDRTVVSNQPYAIHAWSGPGVFPVILTAFNDAHPGGVSATAVVEVIEAVYYVNAGNPTPAFPFTDWQTAATTIQEAISAGSLPGRLVLVTNGVYANDGAVAANSLLTNRVVLTHAVVVRSVNGPGVTAIQGAGPLGSNAVRCAYVDYDAVLSGFTLTNGHAFAQTWSFDYWKDACGGGVSCGLRGVVSNCVMTGNAAASSGGGAYLGTLSHCRLAGNSAAYGAGAAYATLNHCTLTGNSASIYGGGAAAGTLNNCTLSGNSATNSGGGAAYATLNNCIVYFNMAPTAPDYVPYPWSPINYSCTFPLPTNGVGNITDAPVFVDLAGGNLRLQSNSPCINAGFNTYALGDTDLDSRPRIVGGTVDMGAYEYQGAGMGEFIGWLQQFGLPTDGSADFTDSDADLLNTWQEWRCRTDPTNALSVLRLLPPSLAGGDVNVTWQSAAGVNYFLECSTNLGAAPPWLPLATNLPGQPGTTTFADTNAVGALPRFYRVVIP